MESISTFIDEPQALKALTALAQARSHMVDTHNTLAALARRMGEAGHQLVSQQYDFAEYITRMEDLFRELATQPQTQPTARSLSPLPRAAGEDPLAAVSDPHPRSGGGGPCEAWWRGETG